MWAIAPLWQLVTGFQWQGNGFLAGRAHTRGFIKGPVRPIGANRHDNSGDEKGWNQNKMRKGDEHGNSRRGPKACQANHRTRQTITGLENGRHQRPRPGVAVVILKLNICCINTGHEIDSDTRLTGNQPW